MTAAPSTGSPRPPSGLARSEAHGGVLEVTQQRSMQQASATCYITHHSRAMGTVFPCFRATVAWMVPCGSLVAT